MHEKTVFVIRNQLGQYLDKHSGWLSGKDANALFRVDHRDEALNTLIEINAKDITLRGKILEVPVDDRKRPIVEISEEALALDKTRLQETDSLFEDESVVTKSEETGENTDDDELLIIEETVFTELVEMANDMSEKPE